MTCIPFGNITGSYAGFICVNDSYRLKLGNRYVYMSWHHYCGASFSWDADGNKPYDPVDENDPIWEVFGVWLEKHNAAKAAVAAKKLAEKTHWYPCYAKPVRVGWYEVRNSVPMHHSNKRRLTGNRRFWNGVEWRGGWTNEAKSIFGTDVSHQWRGFTKNQDA